MRLKIVRNRKPRRNKNLQANTEAAQLTPEEIDLFMEAADARPYEEVFRAIDGLLTELALTHPIKVAKVRLNIMWLRAHAYHRDLPWGKIK